ERLRWLDAVRNVDLALRGPRPAAGPSGLDDHLREKEAEPKYRGCVAAWAKLRGSIEPVAAMVRQPISLAEFARQLAAAATVLAADRAWRGADGRMAAELLSEL